MSDSASGPGWWQASDSKWYPPEQHPDYRPPPLPPPNLPPPPAPNLSPPPTSTPPPPPFATGAVATPDPPKEKRPIYKEPLFLALIGVLAALTLAAVVGALLTDEDVATVGRSSTPSEQEIRRYLRDNPSFQDDLSEGQEIFVAISDSAFSEDIPRITRACRRLSQWATNMDRYSPPFRLWRPAITDFKDAASACLNGDFGRGAMMLERGGEKFLAIFDQVDAAR